MFDGIRQPHRPKLQVSGLAVDVALIPRPARRHGWERQRWSRARLN